MLTMLLYVLIVGLVAALLFLIASAVFGRAEELGPLPAGTTETVLPAEHISGADVRDLRFQQVFRGYKAGEVDWALARLAARIDELEGQLARARGESPRSASTASVERTGAVPRAWTGATPAVAQPATPRPAQADERGAPVSGEERTVRTERRPAGGAERPVRTDQQSPSGEERTVRTEPQGGPGPTAGNNGTPTARPGFDPTAQSGGTHPGTGAIAWPGPAGTGPWEPPVAANSIAQPHPAPEPHTGSWSSGLLPAVPSGAPHPAVPEISRPEQAAGAVAPGAEHAGSAPSTGSLALPPVTPAQSAFLQPPAHPGGAGTPSGQS